jgi:hypothetical protein
MKQLGASANFSIELKEGDAPIWQCSTADPTFSKPNGWDITWEQHLLDHPSKSTRKHRVSTSSAKPVSATAVESVVTKGRTLSKVLDPFAGYKNDDEHSVDLSSESSMSPDSRTASQVVDAPIVRADRAEGFNASSEDLALQSAEWHMVAVGEDLTCVRTRAKKAFRKMVLTYQKEIDRHKQRATALEEVLRAQQLGGSEYTRLLIERDELAQEFDDLSKKLIDVQKELVDAQERQKDCEAELEQMKLNAQVKQRLDWTACREHVDWLVVGNREDEHILRDVCEYIDKLKSQYNDLAESNDEIVYLLSQTERVNQKLQEHIQALLPLVEGAEQTKLTKELEELLRKDNTKDARAKILQNLMQMGEGEAAHANMRIRQLQQEQLELRNELEAMQASSHVAPEVKPYFTGLGNRLTIPPHLRFHGRLRNINLSRSQLLGKIDDFWRARYASLGSPPLSPFGKTAFTTITFTSNAKGKQKKMDPTLPHAPPVGNFDAYTKVDYANIYPRDGGNVRDIDFSEFVIRHIMESASKDAAFELSYSMVDACRRMCSDPEVDLFLCVLDGTVAEDAFYDRVAMMAKLKQILMREEEDRNAEVQATGKPKGVLKCVEFLTAIERFFPSKSGSHLLALRTALQQDLENTFLGMAVTKKRKKAREADDNAASPGVSTSDGWMDVSVKYKVLFDAGHMGTFLAELKRQHLDEIMSYTSEVESAIFGSTSEGSVSSLKAVKTAIQDLDPDKDPQHIDFMLAAATHTPREHLPWGKELRAATLAEHCRRVLQRRYTPTREKSFNILLADASSPLSPSGRTLSSKADDMPPAPSDKW